MGLVFACAVSITSCGTKSRQASGNSDTAAVAVSVADTATAVVPVYAKGYAVKHLPGNVRLVDIHDPQKEEGNTFRYALVPRGTKPAGIPADYTVIETPVKHVICMTSLQLSNFIRLDACDYVVGITSTRHLFNKEMNGRLKAGKTSKIGIEQTFKINKADQTVTGNTLYVYNRYITVKAAGKGTVTYSSTNKNIAIVNSKSGLVRTKKSGRVQIKITVSGNSNYNKASGIVTLIVTPAKSSITKLASNSSRSLKVTYKKVSGATGYQITYATNKNFKSAKTKYVSAKYGSATIKNLAKNKRYYVRVRAYKTINGKRYMGLGSSVKSVKVK